MQGGYEYKTKIDFILLCATISAIIYPRAQQQKTKHVFSGSSPAMNDYSFKPLQKATGNTINFIKVKKSKGRAKQVQHPESEEGHKVQQNIQKLWKQKLLSNLNMHWYHDMDADYSCHLNRSAAVQMIMIKWYIKFMPLTEEICILQVLSLLSVEIARINIRGGAGFKFKFKHTINDNPVKNQVSTQNQF